MDNLRSLLHFDENYQCINREERNLAAIFYHILLINDNMDRFLKLIDSPFPIIENEFGVYYEYAFLRDLWFRIQDDNVIKRKIILNFVRPDNKSELEMLTVLDFNKYFGAPNPSNKYIQSPSNWSISRFKYTISRNDEFINMCRLKWAFNAKPDVVIHTSKNTAICIECKLESSEGQYPTSNAEIKEFQSRNIEKVSQTSIQKYIMCELLGIDTQFIFLVNNINSKSPTHANYSWKDVFSALDLSGCPDFIIKWIDQI